MESVLRGAVAVAAVGGGGVNHDVHLPEAAQLLQLIVHLLNNIGISSIIQATWEVGRQELWDGLWQCGLNQLGSINRGPHYSQLGSPLQGCPQCPVLPGQAVQPSPRRPARDLSSSPSQDKHSQTQFLYCTYCNR